MSFSSIYSYNNLFKCSFRVLLFIVNLSINKLIIIFDSLSFNIWFFSLMRLYNESKNSNKFLIKVGFEFPLELIPKIFTIKSRLSKYIGMFIFLSNWSFISFMANTCFLKSSLNIFLLNSSINKFLHDSFSCDFIDESLAI